MAFCFKKPVNPEKPLDTSDLPPEGWKFIDSHDYSKALFGYASDDFIKCCEWEKRELLRNKVLMEGFQYNIELKINRTLTKAQNNRLKWLLENAAKEIFCESVMTGKITIIPLPI